MTQFWIKRDGSHLKINTFTKKMGYLKKKLVSWEMSLTTCPGSKDAEMAGITTRPMPQQQSSNTTLSTTVGMTWLDQPCGAYNCETVTRTARKFRGKGLLLRGPGNYTTYLGSYSKVKGEGVHISGVLLLVGLRVRVTWSQPFLEKLLCKSVDSTCKKRKNKWLQWPVTEISQELQNKIALTLYLIMWLALCLFQIASLKWMSL